MPISDDIVDDAIVAINNERTPTGLNELLSFLDASNANVFFTEYVIVNDLASELIDEEKKNIIISAITNAIAEDGDLKTKLLSTEITHVDIQERLGGESIAVVLLLFNKHVDVEAPGPIIDGDLVVQGVTVSPNLGPCVCVVEYAKEDAEEFETIIRVAPWQMMFSGPAAGGQEGNTFAIPLSFKPEYCAGGTIRIRVYVNEVSGIPYDGTEEPYDLENTGGYICATEIVQSNSMDSVVETTPDNTDVMPNNLLTTQNSGVIPTVIQHIRVTLDPADIDTLQSELGYDCKTLEFTAEGPVADVVRSSWKCFIVTQSTTEFVEGEMKAVEEIQWVAGDKESGAVPELEGFEVLEQDVMPADHPEAFFLAVKYGDKATFSKATMVTCSEEATELLDNFLATSTDLFVQAPPAVGKLFEGYFGLLMQPPIEVTAAPLVTVSEAEEQERLAKYAEGLNEDPGEYSPNPTGDNDSPDSGTHPRSHLNRFGDVENIDLEDEEAFEQLSNDGDDFYFSNEESLERLQERVAELESEKERLRDEHLDVERKAAVMIARDKLVLASSAAAGGNKSGPSAESASGAGDSTESEAEKLKHFVDTLVTISDGRAKLSRQQKEYDQLAHDLQTRLDDKEYKAGEIFESFQEFKKEIMSKAQNSRTGKPISRRLSAQYDAAEQKKDGDLEKVRLRNIYLRTSLKKLERTLHSREQLAEGLHMIDFEQLKIENQTLNEKIEERNEELAKLKRKKTSTVQVLTHIREKLKFTENQNSVVKKTLGEVERAILIQRGALTATKHDRDYVRDDNAELKRKQGFATNDLLLVDFERRRTAIDCIKEEVSELQERHHILTNQVKIHTAKAAQYKSASLTNGAMGKGRAASGGRGI